MAPPLPPDDLPTSADIEELNARIDALNRHMAIMIKDRVTTEVSQKAVPRQELADRLRASGKRTIAGLVFVVLLLVGAVLLNRFTLIQAQRDLNNQVVRCFLRPGSITPAQSAACSRRFGPDYAALQQRSRAATADFNDLRRWAKERGWEPPSER